MVRQLKHIRVIIALLITVFGVSAFAKKAQSLDSPSDPCLGVYCSYLPVISKEYFFPPVYIADASYTSFGGRDQSRSFSGFVLNASPQPIYDLQVRYIAYSKSDNFTTESFGSTFFSATLQDQPNPFSVFVGPYPPFDTRIWFQIVSVQTYTLSSAQVYTDIGSSIEFSPALTISPTLRIPRTAKLVNHESSSISDIRMAFYTGCDAGATLQFSDFVLHVGEEVKFDVPECFIPTIDYGHPVLFGAQARLVP